jgi:ABC-type multidrug transport system ATPase subunit
MSAAALGTDTAVSIEGVTYRFGQHRAVEDLDLTVQAGETLGLLGPNGAGKTTTIRLLNTLLPLQEGAIHVFGWMSGGSRWRYAAYSATSRSSCRSKGR